MKRMLAWVVGLVTLGGALAALLSYAPHANPTPITHSGVHGTVLLGPTCPVQRMPPDPHCADRPYQAEFVILSSNGTTAATVSSGADGKFEKELPPGDYTIAPSDTGKVLPRVGSQTFTIHSGQYTEIQIQFDSGIR